eukprot:gene165-14411_t
MYRKRPEFMRDLDLRRAELERHWQMQTAEARSEPAEARSEQPEARSSTTEPTFFGEGMITRWSVRNGCGTLTATDGAEFFVRSSACQDSKLREWDEDFEKWRCDRIMQTEGQRYGFEAVKQRGPLPVVVKIWRIGRPRRKREEPQEREEGEREAGPGRDGDGQEEQEKESLAVRVLGD